MNDDRQDDQKIVNIFERYAITSSATSLAAKAKVSSLAEYRAIDVEKTAGKRVEWLDFRRIDGTSFMLPYHMLTEVYFSSHQHLSLIYASGVVSLTGRRLEDVKTLIQRGQLIAIHCFAPHLHIMPPENDIMITAITRQSMQEIADR